MDNHPAQRRDIEENFYKLIEPLKEFVAYKNTISEEPDKNYFDMGGFKKINHVDKTHLFGYFKKLELYKRLWRKTLRLKRQIMDKIPSSRTWAFFCRNL